MTSLSRTAVRPLFAAAARGALQWTGLRKPLKAVYRRVAFPVLSARPPGSLSDAACTVLLAATQALVGSEIERPRYEDFFRWRAETLPGHRALYERFAETANRLARRSHGRDFEQCDNSMRLAILQPVFRVRTVGGRLDRLRSAFLHRSWILFDLHIIRQIALLFARTDAWRLAGYDSWPGTPRGLDRYQEPDRAGALREAF